VRIRKIPHRRIPDRRPGQPNQSRRAVLTGGAVGLAAVAGASLAWTSPADATEQAHPQAAPTTALVEIMPSADNTGVTDTKNIVSAINALPDGGTIHLGPGDFYITYVAGYSSSTNKACITVPAQVATSPQIGPVNIQGCGSSTVVYVVGSYTGFWVHRTSNYNEKGGPKSAQQTTVFLRDFVINGYDPSDTNSPYANAVGLDIGDGWGYDLNLVIVNFHGSGAVGLNLINRLFWTEKGRFRVSLMNNSTAAVLSRKGIGAKSHEYNFYDFNIFCNAGQQGIVAEGDIENGGCTLWLHGNMSSTKQASGRPANNVAALSVLGGSGFYMAEIVMKVEGNPGGGQGDVYPYAIYFDSASDSFHQCHGIITHSLTPSQLNGGEFTFRGFICGDPGLSLLYTASSGASVQTSSAQPALPPSGTALQNYAPDAMVYVSGSDVTGVTVGPVDTGQTSGGFFLPAGGAISVAYAGSSGTNASWVWVPMARSAY
jgi:hypothetical protein